MNTPGGTAGWDRTRVALALCLGLWCLAAPAAAADPPRPPNVVFIMAEDLGRNLLPLYDLDPAVEIKTPNLDRLAAQGVVFENAWASPVGLVTRVQLMTGRYPLNNGMLGHVDGHLMGPEGRLFLDPKYQRSFAALMKEAGYATALAGRWHGNDNRPGNQPRVLRAFGFDEWMLADLDNRAPAAVYTHEGGKTVHAFPPDALAGFVTDFIARNHERPFFVYWPMRLVHRRLVATPLRPDAATDAEKLAAMTEYADHLLGRLVKTLDELGLRDDTIVFFSGDNGTGVARRENGKTTLLAGGKGTLTEAGINVPFMVSGGPVARRGRTAALTDFTDVLPTLAELAGVKAPASWRVDGVSIAPFLTGRAAETPREWIAASAAVWPAFGAQGYRHLQPQPPRPGRDKYAWSGEVMGVVVRGKRFKLWDYRLGPKALFDLEHDPREQRNLWKSADPRVVAARKRLLAVRAALRRHPAPLLRDQVTAGYGLFAHWRFDGQTEAQGKHHFPDTVGGYDARYEPRAATAGEGGGERAGKFGKALPASTTPAEAAHFIDFFARTGTGRAFRGWKRQSFTLSGWIRRTGPLARDWHLLRQPDAAPPVFTATLHRAAGGVEEDPPLDTASSVRRWSENGHLRVRPARGGWPLERGGSARVTVRADGLEPSQAYRVRLGHAGQGLGSRPDCTTLEEDRISETIRGVRSRTVTFTVYGCVETGPSALAFTVTPSGRLVLQLTAHGGEVPEVSARLPAASGGEWTHVAATWDGSGACGEATLYIDGRAEARACLGDSWIGKPAKGLRLGALAGPEPSSPGPRAWLDDAAVWRQALTPAQVASLHLLGRHLDYDAASVDTLLNAPRDYPVTVGGLKWKRVSRRETVPHIDFGGGVRVRPVAPEHLSLPVLAAHAPSPLPPPRGRTPRLSQPERCAAQSPFPPEAGKVAEPLVPWTWVPDWKKQKDPKQQNDLALFTRRAEVSAGGVLSLAVHAAEPENVQFEVMRQGPAWNADTRVCRFQARVGPQPEETRQVTGPHSYTSFGSWTYNVHVRVPGHEAWPTGFYYVQATNRDGVVSRAPFVVEDRSAPAALCAVGHYLTPLVAHNTGLRYRRGSASYYRGFDGREYRSDLRSTAVTVQRPKTTLRTGLYITHTREVSSFLEREGFPVRYTTDLGIHRDPSVLDGCRAIVWISHLEYIPPRVRQAAADAVGRGVHMMSLQSKSFYWKSALETDRFGDDVMIVNLSNHGDLWRNQRGADGKSLSEQGLFGAQYVLGANGGPATPFRIEPRRSPEEPPAPELMSHWIFEGTGLRFGDQAELLMDTEIDVRHPGQPLPEMVDQVVFLSPYVTARGNEVMAHTVYFERPDGQMTFHASANNLDFAFGRQHNPGVARMIRNILQRMLE